MQRDNNVAIWLYFITIQVACGFFLLELFTGVIIANYYQVRTQMSVGVGKHTGSDHLILRSSPPPPFPPPLPTCS